MTNRKPRKDWTLDSEGSSWAAESTYEDRVARARDKEASRSVGERARALLSKGKSDARLGIKRERG
jgi:hypothetical protein